MTVRSKTA